MPALVSPVSSIKPARWTVNPAWVAPEWRHLWRGLTFACPLWESGGRPFDFASRVLATGNQGTWGVDERGPMVTLAAADAITFDDRAGYQLDGDIAFALWVTMNVGGSGGMIVAARDSFSSGLWEFYENVGILRFSFHNGSLRTADSSLQPTAGPHGLGIIRHPGGAYDFYMNGQAERVILTQVPSSVPHTLTMGDHNQDLDDGHPGDYRAAYIWKHHVPTLEDFRRLDQIDPFGPFRMGRRRVGAVAPPAGIARPLVNGGLVGTGLVNGGLAA